MDHKATVCVDLGHGDSGKGSWVDYFCRKENASLVVRFNGGAQAAHNVVLQDGRHHTFSQFGSGTFVPGVKTFLSKDVLIDPLELYYENEQLEALGVNDALTRLYIDSGAKIVTPYQKAANRLREIARGDQCHGSCGMGIGETVDDELSFNRRIFAANFGNSKVVIKYLLEGIRELKLEQLEEIIDELKDHPDAKADIYTLQDPNLSEELVNFYIVWCEQLNIVPNGINYLQDLFQEHQHVVFEGAQGVLLDEWNGFHPYTTWSTTTTRNANELLQYGHFEGEIRRLGLIRAYSHRHGAGPLPTEVQALSNRIQEPHNKHNDWQGSFRFGYTDLVALKYALDVCDDIDGLAVSNLDQLLGLPWQVCPGYKIPNAFNYLDNLYLRRGQGTQADLTRLITHAEPVLRPVNECMTYQHIYGMLGHIENNYDIPLLYTSHGPTAEDKIRQ